MLRLLLVVLLVVLVLVLALMVRGRDAYTGAGLADFCFLALQARWSCMIRVPWFLLLRQRQCLKEGFHDCWPGCMGVLGQVACAYGCAQHGGFGGVLHAQTVLVSHAGALRPADGASSANRICGAPGPRS